MGGVVWSALLSDARAAFGGHRPTLHALQVAALKPDPWSSEFGLEVAPHSRAYQVLTLRPRDRDVRYCTPSMNIFFDVDETILGYDGSLRPLVKETFQALVEDGHRIFVWSGVRTADEVRGEVVQRHELDPFVSGCYQKPRFDYRAQWARTGIAVEPEFCVDDYPDVVEAFGGMLIKPYSRAMPDTELELVYAAIKTASDRLQL